jgi:CRISPR-associated endonuclease Csn1
MINVINYIIDTYGKPDEIRIELARELKNNAKEREKMSDVIATATKDFEHYREEIHREFGIVNVTRNDILRYRLYLELKGNGFNTLYSNTYIPKEKIFSKDFDIEHIIPQSRLFDDSFSNKTLERKDINIEKADETAYDFIKEKYGDEYLEQYASRINSLFSSGAISKSKRTHLLMKQEDIPVDFINRDLSDSQYIAKKAREILQSLVRDVIPTTGKITDRLREDWQLIDLMQELNWDKYEKIGQTEIITDEDGKRKAQIKDWTKRNDHRHHAMDALTIAFTKRSFIQYLNNLNARSDKSGSIYGIEKNELHRDSHNKLRFNPPIPLEGFRSQAKEQLENILVSFKSKNKVVTRNTNNSKCKGDKKSTIQLTPRGQLHNETIYGSIKRYVTKNVKVGSSFDSKTISTVTRKDYREALLARLSQYNENPKKAFTGLNSLDKNPLYIDANQTEKVPMTVKVVSFETVYTIRKTISPDLVIDKVIDGHIRQILQARLNEYDGNATRAFSNLDENPIWLNKDKGISIKSVTIKGVNVVTPLHRKHDNNGHIIKTDNETIPSDFVSTSNNHHVAIFKDANGDLQEHVVSFFEATQRANAGLPIVDKQYNADKGWVFQFTMKQNEYFVFPNATTGFDPSTLDLLNPTNYSDISQNLFRVQKITTGDYFFRHHLETTVIDNPILKGMKWKRCGLSGIIGAVKIRINHIGQIVSIGEY